MKLTENIVIDFAENGDNWAICSYYVENGELKIKDIIQSVREITKEELKKMYPAIPSIDIGKSVKG